MLYYVVYSKKVANKLERLGFKVLKVEPNIKDPSRAVYFFEDTAELRAALLPLITR